MRHLLVAISAHGYGHLAQTAPILNRLHEMAPDLRITVNSALPEDVLRRQINARIDYTYVDCDVGMVMESALQIAFAESRAQYRRFHEQWPRRVAAEARRLEALGPDLVFANVPYLALAGASLAGIPAVAMCSLNWADIFWHYFSADAGATELHAQMQAAYGSAQCFIQPAPSMPMHWLPRRRPVAPIARLGRPCRAQLYSRLQLRPDVRVVVVAAGGTPLALPLRHWPHMDGVHWILDRQAEIERTDISGMDAIGDMPFLDVARSCDAWLGKPGYGSFAEAACNAIPMLYVARDDWPEAPYLIDWLGRHGRSQGISRAQWGAGEFADALDALWRQPLPEAPEPAGVEQAVRILLESL